MLKMIGRLVFFVNLKVWKVVDCEGLVVKIVLVVISVLYWL